jgi:prevent-host-death family protein
LTNRTLVMYTSHMKITASAFKAQCLRLLDQVSRTGEELIILKRGRPVARVVPAREEKPWLALRGRGEFTGDPFATVVDEADIEALR